MSCELYTEWLSARLDGALSPEENARLEAHLAACPACAALEGELKQLSALLGALPTVEPPQGLKERVTEAVAADKVTPFAPKAKSNPWKKWLATAAAFGVIVAGGYGVSQLQNTAADQAAPAAEAAAEAPEEAAFGGVVEEYALAGDSDGGDSGSAADSTTADTPAMFFSRSVEEPAETQTAAKASAGSAIQNHAQDHEAYKDRSNGVVATSLTEEGTAEKLTLERVKELAQKGEELTWEDFAAYEGVDVGSGLFILLYEVNEDYDLMIGGVGPDTPPMYIHLVDRSDRENYIDIRTDSVEDFLND